MAASEAGKDEPAPVSVLAPRVQQQQDEDDVVNGGQQTHRQHLSSALALLPKKDDDDEETTGAIAYGPSYEPSSSTAMVLALPTSTTTYERPSVSRNAFTGLSNQGATCYMNSLLQSMFMTPEFRSGLYRWTLQQQRNGLRRQSEDAQDAAAAAAEDDEPEEDNIPYQLQRLFAKLQLTSQSAISTKALTKSFGWTSDDVFQQHDVQELCRVLFDALERSFKGTVNETLVNDLYQGALKDYVQCRTCGYESSRVDHFLDLSLVIRPFGSDQPIKSVEEALTLFLTPEVLDQENQWNCDRCKTKRDAIKGLKFSQLPYLLSLQLKRFDFDYATMNRIKLPNQVTFPKFLDMNKYVSDDTAGGRGRGSIARKMSMERHELESKDHNEQSQQQSSAAAAPANATGSGRSRRLSSMDETQPSSFGQEEDADFACFDTWSPAFDPEVMIQRSGPHVYELYSVLMHSGSALGGHYYAYIKSLETGKWYNFNDSTVSEITDTELKTAWGGVSNGGYGMRMMHSTCAYMLMYRLVSPENNVNSIADESIPEYLKQKIRADEERIRKLEEERLEMAKKVLVKFYMKGDKPKSVEKSLHIYRTSSLADALKIACDAFVNEPGIVLPSVENVRLRKYNEYNGLLTETFAGKEHMTLSSLGIFPGHQLFIEVKSDAEDWEEYDPFKFQLFVRRFVDPDAPDHTVDSNRMSRCIQVEDDATVGSLCALVERKFSVPTNKHVRLIKKSATTYTATPVKILNKNNEEYTKDLRLKMDLLLTHGTELFFEETTDLLSPSPAEAYFERDANMINVNFKYLNRASELIRIDRRETVMVLKEEISRRIGLAPGQFKLLRGTNTSGVEIKTVNSTLCKLPIGTNNTVFVVEGVPLNMGEYNFRLMLYTPSTASAATVAAPTTNQDAGLTVVNGPSDEADLLDSLALEEVLIQTGKEESELSFVKHMIISEEMEVDEIRQRVWNTLKEKDLLADDSVTPAHIRLRDVRHNTLTRLLVDGRKLNEASELAVYESRSIAAQILAEPESVDYHHRIIEVVYLDRAACRFDPKRRCEVIILKSAEQDARENSWQYIAEEVSSKLLIPSDRLLFARLPYHRDSCDVLEAMNTYEFLPAAQMFGSYDKENEDYQELYMVCDEAIPAQLVSKEERQQIRAFLATKNEEKASAQRAKYANASTSSSYHYQKPKEAALVIRTKTSGEKKGGSNASNSNGGVSIRTTPTARANPVQPVNASSDTDEEDDLEYIGKPEVLDVDMDIFSDLA